MGTTDALKLTVVAKCSTSKARSCKMELPHATVETPVFMPVGTQGTLKGLLPEQLEHPSIDCRIMLGNTYHLGMRPGMETMEKAEVTTFSNDKLTISKPKLLNLKRMKPKEIGTQQIHQEDIKGLLTNVAIEVVEFLSGGYKIRKIFA